MFVFVFLSFGGKFFWFVFLRVKNSQHFSTRTQVMQPAAKEAEPDYTQPDVCKKFKEAHDVCFLKWYKEDFLSGKASNNNSGDPCEAEWKVYQSCVQVRINSINFLDL